MLLQEIAPLKCLAFINSAAVFAGGSGGGVRGEAVGSATPALYYKNMAARAIRLG